MILAPIAAGQRSGDGAPSYESTGAANDGLDLLGVEADFVGGGSVPRSLACPVRSEERRVGKEC